MAPIHHIVYAVSRRLRGCLRSFFDLPARRAASEKHKCLENTPGSEPVIGFGGVIDAGQFVHGGAVKLLSLREAFRNDGQQFNILYLVSSSQPRFAEDLVRACRRRGIKFVWNQNGVGYPAWAGAEAESHNAPMRRLRAQADFVIYQSEFCRASAEKFLGPATTRCEVLLNPVDLEKFAPRPDHLPTPPLRLLAMGTQNYRERVISVLDCMHHLRADGVDCLLTVAGPLIWSHAADDVRRTVSAYGLQERVNFLPSFSQEEAPRIYRDHHVLLHPKYMDPCPTVVAEALACGLPVVASRSGGIPEMVDDSCARLIDVPESWEKMHTPSGAELASAVGMLVPDLARHAQAARRRATANFGARRWQERHRQIFHSILSHG